MERNESGQGDPSTTLRLLWRGQAQDSARPARGRKPRVGVDQIVAAAIATADRHGLDAMTMGKVAQALSVGTMSLYSHVPGKAELVELMVDAAWTELDLPTETGDPEHWRASVELYAERTLALYRRHPWLRAVSTVRPPLGPGLLARHEYLLGVLSGAGLDAPSADAATYAIVTFTDAAAAAQADRAHAEAASGQSDRAWWESRQEFWETIYDPARYPATTRAWKEGALTRSGADAADTARELGLQWLLDGIAGRLTGTGSAGSLPRQ
ncbi:TetR/AcrR family transcriptional regulator [Nocardiopsis coralliicola]